MEITFCKKNDKGYQSKLNNLLKNVFLDFQFWYDLDLWNENYESYSIIENDEIVSNICLFKTQLVFNGKKYDALSVGAVATKDEYKGRGLSRKLMEHIISKYKETPMYLSANDDVIDFYPKFGFRRVYEKTPVIACPINNDISPIKLAYNDKKVWDYVYNRSNFSSKLDCLNAGNINLFHIHLGYLHQHIYDLSQINTIVIAEQDEDKLLITAVFSTVEISFADLIKELPFKNVSHIEFGFMPPWDDCKFEMHESESDPLFVKNIPCDLGDFKFPELSIT